MRKEFAQAIEKIACENKRIIFITGDLGFMALENVKSSLGERFINAGVCEQNMISLAAALSTENLLPVCYSISPFIVFRPAEQIRLDVCLHNANVKIVGNGGGYGYGIMGATHHAIEDLAVISAFQNIRCYIPFCNEDVEEVMRVMFENTGPAYLRLGFGNKPEKIIIPKYKPFRKIMSGNKLTVVSLGPVSLNAIQAKEKLVDIDFDLFIVSELPLENISGEFFESLKKTGRLLVIEEHIKHGGLGSALTLVLSGKKIYFEFGHLFAAGYPEGLYGSQNYHQTVSGLDADSIANKMREMLS